MRTGGGAFVVGGVLGARLFPGVCFFVFVDYEVGWVGGGVFALALLGLFAAAGVGGEVVLCEIVGETHGGGWGVWRR